MNNEQRKNPRVSLDVRVNYATNAIAHSKDISEGGLCLITEEPLAVGKILNLVFSLPGTRGELQTFGKVVWTKPAGSSLHENGISFWGSDDGTQKRLHSYLARRID